MVYSLRLVVTMMDLSSYCSAVRTTQHFVFLVLRTIGYFFTVLQYIIVPFHISGKEWPNGQPEVEPNFPPQHFPTELDLTA